MIQATELRIGNYLRLTASSPTETVSAIGQVSGIVKDMVIMGDGLASPFRNLEPIPLTEEWLLKAGFEKFGNVYFGGHKVNLTITESFETIFNDLLAIKLNYVHQLQNLYFALTGEELAF